MLTSLYLDIDCTINTQEAIDKWETTLRISIAVNKMDFEISKLFLEKTLLNSVLRFWKNMSLETRNLIFMDDDIA